jgi:hypothetical protein
LAVIAAEKVKVLGQEPVKVVGEVVAETLVTVNGSEGGGAELTGGTTGGVVADGGV